MSPNPFARAAYAETLRKPVVLTITRAAEKAGKPDPRVQTRSEHNSPWWTELRAIGTWRNPGRYAELLTAQVTQRLATEARVRAALVAAGRLEQLTAQNPDTAAAELSREVAREVAQDPALQAVASTNNQAILVEGLAGGEKEVERLYRLGGERLLTEVLDEIHAYHTLDFETGEG